MSTVVEARVVVSTDGSYFLLEIMLGLLWLGVVFVFILHLRYPTYVLCL